MLNLSNPITLSPTQIKKIQKFGTLRPEYWEKNETCLRKQIKKDTYSLQDGKCVYCGCTEEFIEVCDVDHIAHKAKYPEFMFTPQNLALSCKVCNSVFKGTVDTISKYDPNYDKCEFNIIHPYFDDVSRFFDTSEAIIVIKKDNLNRNELKKAQYTFKIFRWGEERMISKRAKNINQERYNKNIINQVKEASSFLPN